MIRSRSKPVKEPCWDVPHVSNRPDDLVWPAQRNVLNGASENCLGGRVFLSSEDLPMQSSSGGKRDYGKERRQFYRRKVTFPCEVRWETEIAQAEVTDLSFGGARISCAEFVPPVGTDIKFKVVYEGEALWFDARVMHQHSDFFGVRFYGAPVEKSIKLLRLFCAYLQE